MTHDGLRTDSCCAHTAVTPYTQALGELDFERTLRYACTLGESEKAGHFLKKGHEVNKLDKYGYAPLHYAAHQGNLAICKLLVSQGAEVNAQTPELGSTPLHRAVVQGHLEVAKLLISKGAYCIVNTGPERCLPVHKARSTRNKRVFKRRQSRYISDFR
ncbi:ankyrin [Basidiobolus meristosporus CBS 931.73]|uniref:Ankyrin n=1 Tax=Basidiobolus meristosporus CBS 931.73 TaxID=1314790 RepID=A0A1Y1Z2T3_9FUNG|nr:ankyrin [Basidiobolus meristosporus CBS 931.73]|eukprot:ORY04496.1 ankyrin [Basidiobolus meristosporus CBS 931.73]